MANGTFASRTLRFYKSLRAPKVPRGFEVMNPYRDRKVLRHLETFLDKYLDDNRQRLLVIGINPGRFGAGITGVTFTDPVALEDFCGIPNHLARRRELSSIFVYDVVERLGGAAAFYRSVFLSAICPLGFTKSGKNVNYYDDRALEKAVTPFIVRSMDRQIGLGCRTDHVVVLGRSANAKYLRRMNELHGWFEQVHVLDHPRPIMQYRRKRVEEYVREYAEVIGAITKSENRAAS